MDETDSREKHLEELQNFTDAVNKQIADIVGTLDWTVESVTNMDKEYLICPYNSSHRVMETSLDDHLTSCQWKSAGYRESDLPLSIPTLPVDSTFSIKFDKQLLNEVLREAKEQNPTMQIASYECYIFGGESIYRMGERLIPHTSDRLMTDFTRDERKVLYDYAVANTRKPDIGQDIEEISNNLKSQEKEDKELSFLEMLVRERNLRRRRVKHKGVHTNKKSHVEVLREVINQQMEIYIEYISGQTNPEDTTDIQSIKTDDSNHETTQDRTDLYASPQSYNDPNSSEKDSHHYSKRDDTKKERSKRKSCHGSRDRDRQDKNTDEYREMHKKKHKHDKESSYSKHRKSHKKDKHRSKDKYRDKEDSKKCRKSRDREKSSEKHYKKHDHYRKQEKNKKHKSYTRAHKTLMLPLHTNP